MCSLGCASSHSSTAECPVLGTMREEKGEEEDADPTAVYGAVLPLRMLLLK